MESHGPMHEALVSWHHQHSWSWNIALSDHKGCHIQLHRITTTGRNGKLCSSFLSGFCCYCCFVSFCVFLWSFLGFFRKQLSFLSESVDLLLPPLFSPCLMMKDLMLFDHGRNGLCRRWAKGKTKGQQTNVDPSQPLWSPSGQIMPPKEGFWMCIHMWKQYGEISQFAEQNPCSWERQICCMLITFNFDQL